MNSDKLKFATLGCAVVWLVVGVLTATTHDLDLHEIFIDGFETLTIALAISLLVRTVFRKRQAGPK
jgi:hypothetical protein